MKKALSLLLCLCMAVTMLSGLTLADDGMTLTAAQPTARPGETVEIPLTLSGNPGISSMKLSVWYDDSVLTLVSAALDPVFADAGGAMVMVNDSANPVVLLWMIPDGEIRQDGAFAALTFTVRDDAPETFAPVSISFDPEDVYNADETDIPMNIEDGGVQVQHNPAGDINGDGKVNNKDLTALAKYLAGYTISCKESYLDVNDDGKINNKDLTRLAQYLAGRDVELFHGPAGGTTPVSGTLTASIPGFLTVWAGNSITVTSSVTGGTAPYSYQWQYSMDNRNWTNGPTGATYNYQPAASPAIQYVKLTVSDRNGLKVDSNICTINVPTPVIPLSVTVSAPSTATAGISATLTASITGGPANDWSGSNSADQR